jgi:hypothetical protein
LEKGLAVDVAGINDTVEMDAVVDGFWPLAPSLLIDNMSWWQRDLVCTLYVMASVLLLMDVTSLGSLLQFLLWPWHSLSKLSSSPSQRAGALMASSSYSSMPGAAEAASSSCCDACLMLGAAAASSPSSPSPLSSSPLEAMISSRGTRSSNSYNNPSLLVVHTSTMLIHCVLVGIILQLQVDRASFMTPAKVNPLKSAAATLNVFSCHGMHGSCLRLLPLLASKNHASQLIFL